MEGPARYSSADVAAAFATALHRSVAAGQTSRARCPQALHRMGFSDKAAESFVAITEITLAAQFPPIEDVAQGATTRQQYVRKLAQQKP